MQGYTPNFLPFGKGFHYLNADLYTTAIFASLQSYEWTLMLITSTKNNAYIGPNLMKSAPLLSLARFTSNSVETTDKEDNYA